MSDLSAPVADIHRTQAARLLRVILGRVTVLVLPSRVLIEVVEITVRLGVNEVELHVGELQS